MPFNMSKTLEDMRAAALAILAEEGADVGECVQNALQQEKEALKRIAEYRLRGDITDEDMRKHLENEKFALEAAMRACAVEGKVVLEKAANAAITALEKAIRSALVIA